MFAKIKSTKEYTLQAKVYPNEHKSILSKSISRHKTYVEVILCTDMKCQKDPPDLVQQELRVCFMHTGIRRTLLNVTKSEGSFLHWYKELLQQLT